MNIIKTIKHWFKKETILPEKLKFTKEIKEIWLDNLKSGKYIQGFCALVTEENHYCCIGVLGDCIPGLSNNLKKYNKERESPYTFLNRTFGDVIQNELIKLNDSMTYIKTGKTDYSNVIPFIEALPITD